MALELFAAKRDGYPLIGWHRGAGKNAPENTMAAFRYAIEHDAKMLELDVQLTADGEIVVFHDVLVNRTTNGEGPLAHYTLEELKQLDAGSKFSLEYAGECVPTLREVIDYVQKRAALTIELKQGGIFYPQLEAKVANLLREMDMLDNVMIISFDHQAIKRIKEIEPLLPAAIVYSGRLVDPIAAVRAAHADAINTSWALLQSHDIEACHKAGIAVHGSQLNDPALGPVLTAMGIDMVDTDYPEQIREAVRQPLEPNTHAALLVEYLKG